MTSRSETKSSPITTEDQIEAQREAFEGNDELFRRSNPGIHRPSNFSAMQITSKQLPQEDSRTLNEGEVEKGDRSGTLRIGSEKDGRDADVEGEEIEGDAHEEGDLEKRPKELTDEDFKVTFNGPDDPTNPQNWSATYRWILTFMGGVATLNATFASSAPSENIPSMAEYFGFGQEVGTATISLFICGYIAGPLIWGPLSEIFGRRICFIVAYVPYTLFAMGGALAHNTATILIMRVLCGTFAACPIVNSGALIADVWDAKRRGIAMSVFALTPFAGPALGPIVGGFIEVTGTSWRWTFWVMTIFAGIVTLLIVLFLPETYAPVIQAENAARKRKETGDNRYWAPHDRKDKSLKFILKNSFVMPVLMLIQEPMLLAITLYQAFVYGLMYLQFESFGFIFSQVYSLSAGLTGLCFLTIFVGGLMANMILIFYEAPRYRKKVDEYAPKPVPPEVRLQTTLAGAILFPVSMFWMGWTCYPSISLASPILAATLLGGCILVLFLTLINYTVDAYLYKAATALAASTVVRSMAGAGFPLFANQMYNALGVHWATTLLACIALLGIPVPLVLIKYGPAIRKMSKNSPYN